MLNDLARDLTLSLIFILSASLFVSMILVYPISFVFESFGADAPTFKVLVAAYFSLFTTVSYTAKMTKKTQD